MFEAFLNFDKLLSQLPPEWVAVLLATGAFLSALGKVVAAATGIVMALKLALPRMQKRVDLLRAWADKTETGADNAFVGLVASSLTAVGPWLDGAVRNLEWLKGALEIVAGNRWFGERVVKIDRRIGPR